MKMSEQLRDWAWNIWPDDPDKLIRVAAALEAAEEAMKARVDDWDYLTGNSLGAGLPDPDDVAAMRRALVLLTANQEKQT